MTVRLSQSSLTGTERTEVAVGTSREASMFCTVRAGAPRSTVYVGSSRAVVGALAGTSLATGLVVPRAGSAAAAAGRGVAFGAGVELVDAFSSLFGACASSEPAVFASGFAASAACFASAGFCSVGFCSVGAAGLAPLPDVSLEVLVAAGEPLPSK